MTSLAGTGPLADVRHCGGSPGLQRLPLTAVLRTVRHIAINHNSFWAHNSLIRDRYPALAQAFNSKLTLGALMIWLISTNVAGIIDYVLIGQSQGLVGIVDGGAYGRFVTPSHHHSSFGNGMM